MIDDGLLLGRLKAQVDDARMEVARVRSEVNDLRCTLAAVLGVHPNDIERGPDEHIEAFFDRIACSYRRPL